MFIGWRIVGVTLMTQALQAGLLIYSFGVIIVPIGQAFAASRETLMLATALLSLSSNVISPFAGVLVDRSSLRRLMLFGVGMLALAFVLLAGVTATWQVLAVFALIMPFGNLLLGQLTASALITQWFRRLRGRALGISAIGTSIGGLVAPPALAGLRLIVVVGNDGAWGTEVFSQRATIGRDVNTRLGALPYERVAEGFGCRGLRVERENQLEAALDAAFASADPIVVNVLIDPEAGAALKTDADLRMILFNEIH